MRGSTQSLALAVVILGLTAASPRALAETLPPGGVVIPTQNPTRWSWGQSSQRPSSHS